MDINFQFALFLRERASELHPEHTGWLEELTSKQSQGLGWLCCVPVSTSAVMSQGSRRLCLSHSRPLLWCHNSWENLTCTKLSVRRNLERREKGFFIPSHSWAKKHKQCGHRAGGERAKAPPCILSSVELTELLNRLCWSHMGQGCPCFYYKNSKTHHS